MKIVADSGSTKTKFVLTSEENENRFVLTDGINPFYQTTDDIVSTLTKQLVPYIADASKVQSIEFYGAGCTKEKSPVVAEALKAIFKNASITVDTDLTGAAKALCGSQPGIACILGTGSNSCLWDGENIVKNVSPLGFILGDEGSGAVLGKLLIADILKNQAPAEICEKFNKKYGLTAADIIDRVYRKQFPNRFLASFAPFLSENIENAYCRTLVYNAFVSFIRRNLKQYPDGYTVSFTGSVAYHFKEILTKAVKDEDMKLGIINKSPL